MTEHRRAEEKLQRSHDALLDAERLAKIGSWTLDLRTQRISTSRTLQEMHGRQPGEPPLTAEDLKDMLPPEGYEKVQQGIARCVATGIPYEVETEHLRRDGSTYFCHIRGQANRDESGKIVSLTGTVQDISERKEARERLAAIADNLPNGAIYRMQRTPDGQFAMTYISAGVAGFLGVDAAEIVTEPALFLETIHAEDRVGYLAALEESFAGCSAFDHQCRALKPAGKAIWIHARSVPRRQPDGSTVWDGILRDVTEERNAAEVLERARDAARSAEQAKSEFLATMSHEIRTPMNTVLGMTRLVLQTDLAPRQRNYLEKINMAANTLISIINDILDYSKIEAGRLELEQAEFTIESVLESVAAVTAMRAEEKGLEIVYSVAPDVPSRLVGDSLRLGQVMINLVSNAVKFTERGEVVVSIERLPAVRPNSEVLQFEVRDTGIGLSPEQIAGLFRAFSQAERDVSRKYGGTGLGLAICKQLVEHMGGSIWVTSQMHRGSSFFFTIDVGRAASRSVPQPSGRTSPQGRRVLIVDDNASSREILSQMVRNFGMQVEDHASGVSALAALERASRQHTPFEIVLMDWRMPEMDGLEAAQRIKADRHLCETPAVLMVTAYGREEVLRRSEQLGLQGVLIKPVTESMMFNTIMDTLDHVSRLDPFAAAGHARREPPGSHLALHDAWLTRLHHRRVLVVDDNALNREVVTDFLALAHVTVESAANGREALSILEQRTFDAVLMDVHMPVMDGLAAAREIRLHPRWQNLPIIALTAQARMEDRHASLAAGMNAHITKPIDERELYRTLLDLMPEVAIVAYPAGGEPAAVGDEHVAPPAGMNVGCVDLTAALARLGNNPERLSRLLSGFLRDFSTAPKEAAKALRDADLASIAALAHAVKGSASYLDASSLCHSAERLERCARDGDATSVQDAVPEFNAYLEAVLAHLEQQMARKQSSAPHAVSAMNSVEESAAVLELLEQAEPLMMRSDYAAQTLLEQVSSKLALTGEAAVANQIRHHFEELELDSAVRSLQQLRLRLRASAVDEAQPR